MITRKELANALRVLAMDAVEKANSGHPGAPMGMADMAEALWRHTLKHNPANPTWVDRDRFVLSNGHASMLLYSLLHLTGYAVSMDDIRNFRQWESKTPGHPEYGVTPGVEMTTGPLGQGIATAVGMALAERHMASQFNRQGHTIVDHHTYVFLGDGCMMEGISHEASSLAGTLGLGKLIALYDANGITIDGHIDGWFTEDVARRYEAYNWHVIRDVDGHDAEALDAALAAAKAETTKPSLIICRTHIAYGSPNKVDSHKSHGSPLGAEEIAATRKALGWTDDPFSISEIMRSMWDMCAAGAKAEEQWQAAFQAYKAAYPELGAEFLRRMQGILPDTWEKSVQEAIALCNEKAESIATRVASQKALTALAPMLPELLGGDADLVGSVGTLTPSATPITPTDSSGNYLYYGVREFAMSAIMNGMTLHGGIIPYAGTFMIFSDYAKNAIRLAALMDIRAVWVLTHDSIGVGEDGPTHQPIEQVPSLRLTPGVHVWRPCDTLETLIAWKCAIEDTKHPHCLSLTRQNVPFMQRSAEQIADIARGGYVLHSSKGQAEAIIIATGSEVQLALAAAQALEKEGVRIRVVSMPCVELFEAQEAWYKEFVLPAHIRARVAVEAASSDYWYKYVGLDGSVIGMQSFGASAPASVLTKHFGFSVDNVIATMKNVLQALAKKS